MESPKLALIILDGWGYGQKVEADAIQQANTPFIDSLHQKYPHSQLITFGNEVGLPKGQMGNSEVGHLNIGAGRVVYQELARINKSIRDNAFVQIPVLKEALNYAQANQKPIHLIGLLSDGGVHSHIGHLMAICDITASATIPTYIHAFTDGRDTDPKGGKAYLQKLSDHIEGTSCQVASVIGRYYAMDRDKRWERIKLAYDLLVKGDGKIYTSNPIDAIQQSYDEGKTDEFIDPIVVTDAQQNALATIQEGDVVLCFNFRTDRPREITQVLSQSDMPEHDMKKLDLHYVMMTRYDNTFKNVHVLFEKGTLQNGLGEVLANAGKSQLRMAETEKYPHVTYFFSGGKEEELPNEKRIVIPSPKVATYDMAPEMSAIPLTEAAVQEIKTNQPDFICLNYANADMVGHTGDFQAAIKAAETVDSCTKDLIETLLAHHYEAMIIADHGNSDFLINEDGSPNTAHTKNPVPFIYVHQEGRASKVKDGKLGDIAPTILTIMGLAIPEEMTGNQLIEFNH